MYTKTNTKTNIGTSGISVIIVIFCVLMAVFPQDAVAAAKDGLLLWFNNVLPALLPFIVGINLLMGLGTLSRFGKFLSPVMRPLFGVSGAGGFALAAGMISGYPMGAKIVSALRKNNSISKVEAQRLIGFSNNSGPLFIIGAVGIGMFGSSSVGYFILAVHYLSAVLSGILHRFYKTHCNSHEPTYLPEKKYQSQSFLTQLSESVKNAMETILMIGGFIIIFSVISSLLQQTGIIFLISELFANEAQLIGLNANGLSGVLTGIIEITNGANIIAASAVNRPAILAATAVISFGGFSIHAQAAGFIKETDISFGGYLLSKIVHGALSIWVGLMLWPFII